MNERTYDFRNNNDDIEQYRVLANEDIPSSTIALQQGDTPIFSIGDISCVTGLPKSRKTFLITAIAVAFLKDGGFLSLSSELDEKRILIVDTEQSKRFVQILVRRIYRLMEWDYSCDHMESIQILSLRELTPEKRWEVVQTAIKKWRPQMVLIDGSSDLIENTNDETSSFAMVQNLMRIASVERCHVCNVVHTNPNSEKTRGHFGSELQRKSETVMFVQKDGDTTTVKPQFTRSVEFLPFSFRINEYGVPEQTEVVVPKQENLRAIFEEIFAYSEFLSFVDLRDRLMKNTGKGKTSTENRIRKGLTEKIIYKDINGFYRLYFEAEETNLPFTENSDETLPF